MTKHGRPAPEALPGKRVPTTPEPGSLEDLNVTGQAPIEQPGGDSRRPQPAGLEDQNITRPAPPK